MNRWTLDQFQTVYNQQFHERTPDVHHLIKFFDFHMDKLPLFLPDHYLELRDLSDDVEIEKTRMVPIHQIYGDTWVFMNNFGNEDRPMANTLAFFFTMSSHEHLFPIDAVQVNSKQFYIDDGNHRLYAAYLRGWTHIPLTITLILS